ncbi:MAG: class I SAM-dependent methyltransferase [Pseudanabaenales cyanobacterium]|nr:class I SAM-dependent methyltransferase [Pseudanabaenales cyanobacterium]
MSNYYDWIADRYDVTRPLPTSISEQVADCILNLVKATPETTFLEPGIGTGRTSFPIIKRGYPFTGIDISPPMMAQLRQKLQGIPNRLTLIQTDASSLPFADNTFDVAMTTHMLHCLPNWLQGLAEIRRVLKPKGIYLACENLLTEHQKAFEKPLREFLALYQSEVKALPQEGPRLRPFGQEMVQVLTEQGATVEIITAARWRLEQTVGELLNVYRMKAVGLCWTAPDQVFSKAMAKFIPWSHENYGSEDVRLASEATFEITVAHNWASG